MINSMIRYALQNRLLVLVAIIGVAVAGYFSYVWSAASGESPGDFHIWSV